VQTPLDASLRFSGYETRSLAEGVDVRKRSVLAFLLTVLAAPPPEALTVPPALSAKTCVPELSGISWVPALKRYVVVSDDTGQLDTPTWHAPWVFTVDLQGVFDPQVRVLEGLESLDDGESLTPGPDGTCFLTTSHAMTKKAQPKPARRQLVWLAVDGERLVVRGRFDLSTLGLERVAAGRDDELDIEALAFRDGALFIGLKAPLDEQRRASILRLADVVSVLEGTGKPVVTRWASPLLEVADAEGKLVPEGVTDLLFLDDGRLLLAANAPKSGKPDGGGALWLLEKPDAKPVLLHRFTQGLKPEGLTFTPDAKRVVVVFDRGQDGPQWVHVPVP
jgi:hypothetical protein